MGHENKVGRDSILRDLVSLHRSLGSDEATVPTPVPAPEQDEVKARIALFFENMPAGVLLAEIIRDRYRRPLEYRVLRMNRRFGQLVGRSPVTLLKGPFFDVVPGGREAWENILETVTLKGEPSSGLWAQASADRRFYVRFFLVRRDTLAVVIDNADEITTLLNTAEAEVPSALPAPVPPDTPAPVPPDTPAPVPPDALLWAAEVEQLRQKLSRLEPMAIGGSLFICGRCSRINDSEGHWMLPHPYLALHTRANVHTQTCPYCKSQSDRDLAHTLQKLAAGGKDESS